MNNYHCSTIRWTLLVSLCFSLAACISLPQSMTQLKLLKPSSFGFLTNKPPRLVLYQIVKITSPKHTSEHTVVLEINREEVRLRALSPFGQTVFELSYNGTSLSNNASYISPLKDQQAHHMMALIMFSLWPESALASAYEKAVIIDNLQKFETSPLARTRSLEYHGRSILDVTYDQPVLWSKNIQIDDHINQFSLSIQTLEVME